MSSAQLSSEITIAPADPVGETARELIGHLCAEMTARYGSAPSPFSATEFAVPRSVFLEARLRGEPVGCGAIRSLSTETGEIKRMYVTPQARGKGVARKILAELEEYARQFDYHTLCLETGTRQPEAQALYESIGFRRIPAFGPYVENPTSLCYEKTLGSARDSAATTTALPFRIRRINPESERANQLAEALAGVTIDCVEGGASIGFMQPLSHAKALAFWRGVLGQTERGERILLVAEEFESQRIVGTVQVVLTMPENQPHRADIAKMQVHRSARGRGLGAALMRAAEAAARDTGRTLLVLDTVTGGDAERLYTRLGWTRCGEIPGFALWPSGGFCTTTIFYKHLASRATRHQAED